MNPSDDMAQAPIETTPSLKMLRTLGLVATISGLLVVLSYRITLPMIEQNKREAIERALYRLVPDAVSRRDFIAADNSIKPAGEDLDGEILYAYDPYCQCIRGFEVLKMAETPGIGDKIIKDPAFLQNFEALQAAVGDAAVVASVPAPP